MSFVTLVTPGTVDVRINAAAKVVVKACKVQNGYRVASGNPHLMKSHEDVESTQTKSDQSNQMFQKCYSTS